MKILFIAAANSVHTVKWVNTLSARGHKVVLVSLPDQAENENMISAKVKTVYLPVGGSKGYYLNGPALRKIYQKFQPDVSNAHYASGYGTLARVAKIPKLILSVWGSDVYEFPYQSRINMFILKRNLNYAYQIASTSHCMARQTEKLMGREMHIAVTPFGVDTDLFRPDANEIVNKPQKSKVIFGIVKTLSSKYGINDLITAYEIFVHANEGAEEGSELLIYGEGEDRQKLEQQAKATKLTGIHFKGRIPNDKVPAALREMDIFCCGSREESFGVSAVEAMACGLPVIATDAEGFMEVVEDGVTGYIVRRQNPMDMAEKMVKLYKNEQRRHEFGENGRKRVLKLYDWERNVDVMEKIYLEVLGINMEEI